MNPPRACVVIAPNWLGDAVMCLPALGALRAALPQAALRVLARPAVAPMFQAADLHLEVQIAQRPRGFGLQALAAVGNNRTEPAPELAILFPNSFYAALTARALRPERIVGYARYCRAALLTDAIAAPRPGEIPAHESFYYLELLRRAGIIAALPTVPEAHLRADAGLTAAWSERLREASRPWVAIHAGASYGTAKCWLPERFAATAADLVGRGATVLLVGSPGERGLAEQVRAGALAAGAAANRLRNHAGETSLVELMALLSLADALIANDSGPMHLAAALGTPVVAIFGSTNERQTHPIGGSYRIVKAPNIACSPCKRRECPIDHRCMTRIAAAEVVTAALDLTAAR